MTYLQFRFSTEKLSTAEKIEIIERYQRNIICILNGYHRRVESLLYEVEQLPHNCTISRRGHLTRDLKACGDTILRFEQMLLEAQVEADKLGVSNRQIN